MRRLYRRRHAQDEHAFLIVWVDDLRVFDAEAVRGELTLEERVLGAEIQESGLHRVYGEAVGQVAYRVDIDLVPCAGPLPGEGGECAGVYEEGAGCFWPVGVGL